MNKTGNYTIDYKTHFLEATFHYIPNIDLGIALTILFACATVVMTTSIFLAKNRPWYIWILFVCVCLETLGYGTRVECSQSAALGTFIVQAVIILVVPIAIALVNYIVIGLLLEASGRPVYCLTPTRVARLFFASDVGAFFVQSSGASMMANEASAESGRNLALIGVVVQLGFFSAFVLLIAKVAYGSEFRLYMVPELRDVFRGVIFTSALLYARNIYRTIEFIDSHGYVATNEWVFVVFESFAILLCFAGYSIWNFGRLLPATQAELDEIVSRFRQCSSKDANTVSCNGGNFGQPVLVNVVTISGGECVCDNCE